jgi:hypothetical protein
MDAWDDISFLFPRRVDSAIAGLEEAKNLAGKTPPPDSDLWNFALTTGGNLRINCEMLPIFWFTKAGRADAAAAAAIPPRQA